MITSGPCRADAGLIGASQINQITVSRPRPPRILCAEYPSRLSASTQHQLAEATSHLVSRLEKPMDNAARTRQRVLTRRRRHQARGSLLRPSGMRRWWR
jgi:hypothetical protein